MTGWAILLGRLSGQEDVVIGTPVANRQRGDVESLIGFFANTLALRVRLAGDPSVAELLAQVKRSTLEAYGHQDLPFDQVVDAIQAPRSMSHNPVFQVMLTTNNTPHGELAVPGLVLTPMASTFDSTPVDLHLSLAEDGDALTGTLKYASALF
ncbi:condensation domain-containing protein [Massilia sp. H-1]|nr:condensation domain-containing protein [Massilia sp. H-1]